MTLVARCRRHALSACPRQPAAIQVIRWLHIKSSLSKEPDVAVSTYRTKINHTCHISHQSPHGFASAAAVALGLAATGGFGLQNSGATETIASLKWLSSGTMRETLISAARTTSDTVFW